MPHSKDTNSCDIHICIQCNCRFQLTLDRFLLFWENPIFFLLKLFPKEHSNNPFGVPQVSCLHVCILYKMFQECNHRKVKLWLIKSPLRYVKTSNHRSDDRWLKCCLNDIPEKTLPPYFKTFDSLNIHIDLHEIHLSVTPFGTSISKSKITVASENTHDFYWNTYFDEREKNNLQVCWINNFHLLCMITFSQWFCWLVDLCYPVYVQLWRPPGTH